MHVMHKFLGLTQTQQLSAWADQAFISYNKELHELAILHLQSSKCPVMVSFRSHISSNPVSSWATKAGLLHCIT